LTVVEIDEAAVPESLGYPLVERVGIGAGGLVLFRRCKSHTMQPLIRLIRNGKGARSATALPALKEFVFGASL
jgi:hypothetical protein